MNSYIVVPHSGQSRFRLVRQGRTVLFTTGGGPAAAALAGWCRLFGDRDATEILSELTRVTTDNPALGAFILAVLDDDGVEVAVTAGLPVAAHGPQGIEVVRSDGGVLRRRLTDVSVLAVTVPGTNIWSVVSGAE